MNQEVLNNFQCVVHELFIRWDGLKLAVEHMGGRNGQQVSFKVNFQDTFELLSSILFETFPIGWDYPQFSYL